MSGMNGTRHSRSRALQQSRRVPGMRSGQALRRQGLYERPGPQVLGTWPWPKPGTSPTWKKATTTPGVLDLPGSRLLVPRGTC